ncbi:MAG: hypothetical protein QM761_12195 [Pseudoxanthomonas sp.]
METAAMRLSGIIAIVALSSISHLALAAPRESVKLFKLVNRGFDSVTSLAVAPTGTDAYREVYLGEPLRGGGDSATVEIPAEYCRYDLRFSFRNGKKRVYEDVDVCRSTGLRIESLRPGKDGRYRQSGA